ncbi:MAG: pyruvate formate lyase family protein [Victivallales bacterium]|jgi:formate C-acetyltransferase
MSKTEFNISMSPRISEFLRAAKERALNTEPSPRMVNRTKAFFEIYKDEPLRRRQALSFAYELKNEPVRVFDRSFLTGQIYHCKNQPWDNSRWSEFDMGFNYLRRIENELPEIIKLAGFDYVGENGGGKYWVSPIGGAPAHIGWHWDWVVNSGIEGIFKRIEAALPKADEKGKIELECMRICLQSVLDWADAHVKALESKLSSVSASGKKGLLESIEICKRVPRSGARNFREAVQAFHFSYLATIFENPYGGNGPGRLDYFLWPYLEKDLESGVQSLASAREVVDELFIRFHERLCWGADGHVETIVVGGSHPDGSCAANPLTRIMVESISSMGELTHPSVYIRIPHDAPEWLTDLSANYLLHGGNRAQILNDDEIVKAITRDGHIPANDANMYMCGGCMEISPFAMNGDLLFTGFFNVGKVLEYVMTGGACLMSGKKVLPHLEKDLSGYKSFEEFYKAFVSELDRILTLTFKRLDIYCEESVKFRQLFLVSSQVDDCIKKGRVINDGGARYEDYGSTPLGIPNSADSLSAIREAVFRKKFVTASALLDALKNNFAGQEPLRRKLASLPKYGQGDKEADEMMARLTADVCASYERYTNRLGGKVKPMIMTFMMAAPTGAAVGASPDGRLAGTPIAQGITPQSCAMTKGVTTAMLSANTVPIERFSGGASHIWDIDPSYAKFDVVRNLLGVFFKTGGQMFQGNVTDVEKLIDAQKNPEEHAGMTVRIGGFSAVFVNVGKEVQDEVITRRRHVA